MTDLVLTTMFCVVLSLHRHMISPHGSQTLTGINMTADRATVLAPGRPQHIMHSGQAGTTIERSGVEWSGGECQLTTERSNNFSPTNRRGGDIVKDLSHLSYTLSL